MPSARPFFASIRRYFLPLTLLLLTVFIASCGGGSTSTAGSATSATTGGSGASSNGSGSSTTGSSSSQGQQKQNVDSPAQYLIKSLKVSMNVKDTTKAADALQTWITTTDTSASSAGITYEQADNNNLYNVSLTFSVRSTLYPQIESYLRDYASHNGGQLLSLNETVQDVTNDYIDTQSRLTNLRTEQTRLLNLLGHAQALGDIITIQDKLTDIEGQIETIEAHLKELNGQVSYYTVAITLQPLVLATPSSPTPTGWSLGQTFHDAFAASLGFAQGMVTLLVWLLAYSVYLIPLAILAWFVFRWRKRSLATSSPAPK